MSFRGVLLLLVAVSAAGLTAVFARNWITAERAAILASIPAEQPRSPTPEVLVASTSLPAADGSTLAGQTILASARWQVPKASFTYSSASEASSRPKPSSPCFPSA